MKIKNLPTLKSTKFVGIRKKYYTFKPDLKTPNNIVSSLILFLFTSSLLFSSFSSFSSGTDNTGDHSEQHFIHKQETTDAGNALVFEESEIEKNENGLNALAVIIPYFTSFFKSDVSSSRLVQLPSLGLSPHSPIYLAISNFRI